MIRLSDYDTEQEGLVRCGRKPSSPGAGLLCYRLLSGSRPGALAGLCSNSGDCCGGYSWVSDFFFVQSLKPLRKIRVVGVSLDAKIPFLPQWMWVYGVRYYVFPGPAYRLHRDGRRADGIHCGRLCRLTNRDSDVHLLANGIATRVEVVPQHWNIGTLPNGDSESRQRPSVFSESSLRAPGLLGHVFAL